MIHAYEIVSSTATHQDGCSTKLGRLPVTCADSLISEKNRNDDKDSAAHKELT